MAARILMGAAVVLALVIAAAFVVQVFLGGLGPVLGY